MCLSVSLNVPSSSTLLTRSKIHSDTTKITLTLFDPPLRTKSNYSLPKLLPKPHNKTDQSHTISPLPYLTILPHPNPNKFNTNKQNITQNTTLTQHSHINPTPSTNPQQNSTQTPNNTTYA